MVYFLIKVQAKALIDRGVFGDRSIDDMVVIAGSERFLDIIRLARQNAHHIRFNMDQLFISTHKGYVDGSIHRMSILGQDMCSISRPMKISYDASLDDGPYIFPNGHISSVIDGVQSEFKIGPGYQRCCKTSQDAVWLSAHVFKTSGADWDPKLFDIDLEHVEDHGEY
jgi:hypothetical protein